MRAVLTLSNLISFLRAPLAFLFLIDSMPLRLLVVLLAMISDSIDGYLARKSKTCSPFGAVLDPVMDKFFVGFVLTVLLVEKKIVFWQAGAMLTRDFFLCIFGIYLRIRKRWEKFKFRSIRWGKVTTALQFFVFIALCLGKSLSWNVFSLFIVIGLFAFYELCHLKNEVPALNNPNR